MAGPENDLLELTSKRHDLLEVIESGTREKRELTDELPLSRPTVDRAIRELEDAGMVVRDGSECAPTLLGHLLNDLYSEFAQTVDTLESSVEFTSQLPADAMIDKRAITGAVFSTNPDRLPAGPLPAMRSMIDRAQEVQAVVARILPQCIEEFHKSTRSLGPNVEFVMHAEALETALNEYGHPTTKRLRQPGYKVYRANNTPPFDTFVFDQKLVCIRVYSRHEKALVGSVKNDTEAAVTWAHDLFLDNKRDAEAVKTVELEGSG